VSRDLPNDQTKPEGEQPLRDEELRVPSPSLPTGEYDSEMQRAAWNAGAKWAGENPNRRTNNAGRFAHPRRRASDTKLPYMVKRAVAVGATTLTLYAISRTLWRAKTTPEDES